MSHTTDWFPGRVTEEYRQGYERIFGSEHGKEQEESDRKAGTNSLRLSEKRD